MKPLASIAEIQRLVCMDEEDRLCDCGERIAVRWCSHDVVVRCPSCGRIYSLTSNPKFGVESTFPKYSTLAKCELKRYVLK
jgi:hypothetical protein